MEKTGFNTPLKSVVKEKEMKSPWNFNQPPYDERSSCYVNAGYHKGVGHKQPIGHKGDPKMRVSALPYGKVNTLKDDGVEKKNLRLEIDV